MAKFGKSFVEQVDDAIRALHTKMPEVKNLTAKVEGKTVTLTGEAPSLEAKARVMQEFNKAVDTANTLNLVRIVAPPESKPAAPAPAPALSAAASHPKLIPTMPGERIHEVTAADTLSGIAKRYYGNGNLFTRLFEYNRDVLTDPNKIRVGQRLRIPPKDHLLALEKPQHKS